MKTILALLLALGVCGFAGTYQYKQYWNTGGTFVDAETWQIKIDVIPLGPLPSGGTITITEAGGANGSLPANPVQWTTTTTAPYILQGTAFTWTVSPMPNPTATTFSPQVTTSWGGQTNDVQFTDTWQQNKVGATTKVGGNSVTKVIYRTIIIKPPNWEDGRWNILINTRTDKAFEKDYMVVWSGDTSGRLWPVPAQNPTVPASSVFQHDEQVPEGTTPGKSAIVYRRTAGASWVVIWSGSVAYGTTQIINDLPTETLNGTAPDSSNTPPTTASTQGSSGAGTGSSVDTTGNGLTPSTTGSSGSTSTGTGGTGGGGSGTDGLTEAEVERAVHDGISRAASDTGPATIPRPTLDTTGTGFGQVPWNPDDMNSSIDSAKDQLTAGAASLRAAGASLGSHFTQANFPSVSTDQPVWNVSLPVLGSMTIDLTPYAEQAGLLRALLLGVLTCAFLFINVRVVKGAIS